MELYSTYPVLARSLWTRVEQWTECGLELFERLGADLTALAETFGISGELVGVEPGLGDRHGGGRTVAALEFSSGHKVVYKPRSLALAAKFQDLLEWLGDRGVEPAPRTLAVLDRETYGWIEFVAPRPCRNADEVRRFYQRQGIHLAILYALGATDFHHQNLIAAGEYPVLIDLETLFQPMLLADDPFPTTLNPTAESVLRSGLLPLRARDTAEKAGLDLSGLGARHGQRVFAHLLNRVGTDEMAYSDQELELEVGDHLPTLEGMEIPLGAQLEVVVESFEAAYRRLLELRSELRLQLERFAGLEIRVLIRPTVLYSRLLYAGHHPDCLQDSVHREQTFDKLWLSEDWDVLTAFIPAERRALLRGDVPRLWTKTDSRDLVTDDLRVSEILPASGLDRVRERLEVLDEDDLERQKAVIRLAFAAARAPGEAADEEDPRRQIELPAACRPESGDFLQAACRLGERLEALAFRRGERVGWFYLAPDFSCSALRWVGPDLYDGHGGIALFLAQLGRLSAEPRFTHLARRALAEVRRAAPLTDDSSQRSQLGLAGLGGRIYVLTCLGLLWDEPELLVAAEDLRDLVAPAVAADEQLDLIRGSTGALAGLLALYGPRPAITTLEAAIACGDHLLARAEEQSCGRAWVLPDIAEEPPTGFAHGAAGMAWALARLAVASGEARFEDAARAGLAYERGRFSPRHDNWPNLHRPTGDEVSYRHAWCYGAPGIGLSRLDLLDILADDALEAEVHAAVRTTRARGFGGSQCLCHGDFGNLELLSRAAERLDDAELRAIAAELAGRIQTGLVRDGARCGLGHRVEVPGLMTGLAGIGYGLLRVAFPESVPSVLLLETAGLDLPGAPE